MAQSWFASRLRALSGTTLPGVLSSTGEILVDGRVRSFVQVLADATAHGHPAAVLIVLHGSSQTGQSVRSFSGNSFDHLAAGGNVAVVYPDGLQRQWNHNKPHGDASNDVAFMAALAGHFHALHGPIPVIIAGFSNGGQLLIRLIHEIPWLFQGAAIIGATLPRPGAMVFADAHLPVPVVLIHGTHDFVVPYGGEGWFWSLFGARRGPSAVATAQYFAARNRITAAPAYTLLPHRRESGRTFVLRRDYEQDGREPVCLFTVAGGGHVVPNRHRKAIVFAGRTTQDLSTSEALCAFFPVLSAAWDRPRPEDAPHPEDQG